MVTDDDLKRILGHKNGLDTENLNEAMRICEIDTPLREAAFLAHLNGDCLECAKRWLELGCNELADEEKFHLITKLVTGSYKDYKERLMVYEKAKEAFY